MTRDRADATLDPAEARPTPAFWDEVHRARRATLRGRLHTAVDRIVDSFESATSALTLDELVELDRLLSKTLGGEAPR